MTFMFCLMRLFSYLDTHKANNCEEEVGCPYAGCSTKFDGGSCNVSRSAQFVSYLH